MPAGNGAALFARATKRAACGFALLLTALLGSALAPSIARADAQDADALTLTIRPADIWRPAAVSDLSGVPGSEGQALLLWTAPNEDSGIAIPSNDPVAQYQVRYATYTVASVGGSTTTWWNGAPGSTSTASALAPGNAQSLLLNNLFPGATYFFALRSLDEAALSSDLDFGALAGPQASVVVYNAAPATPSGIALAVPSTSSYQISWNDLSPAQKGLDFVEYRVYRATATVGIYQLMLSTTSTQFVDTGYAPQTLYSYRITARDFGGLESSPTPVVQNPLSARKPLPPLGLSLEMDSSSATLRWHAVQMLDDGTPFANPSAPNAGELTGYAVLRSTGLINSNWVQISTLPASAVSYSGTHGGYPYYYALQSYSALGYSARSFVLGLSGDYLALAPDRASTLNLSESSRRAVNRDYNGLGYNISVAMSSNPAQIGGRVLQSITFTPLRDGVTPLSNFLFPAPNTISMHYDIVNGQLVGKNQTLDSGPSAQPNATDENSLAVYWTNGERNIKLYGSIDKTQRTVTVQSASGGTYQLRAVARDSEFHFDPQADVSGRVITPNGDGLNDLVVFRFDQPREGSVEGKIYDVQGAFVADMAAGADPLHQLVWDGKAGGKAVASGVYVYQMKADGKTFNGTIVVAR